MKKKILTLLVLLVALVVPAGAAFKEKDLASTLKVLLYDLRQAHQQTVRLSKRSSQRVEEQQRQLVRLIRDCNELSIMLYSQPQDLTFDLTYALNQVTRQYKSFDANRLPYDRIVESLRIELERYDKLAQTLRNIPPVIQADDAEPTEEVVLDSLVIATDTLLTAPSFVEENGRMDPETAALRDSCLLYAEEMVQIFWDNIHQIEEDNAYYTETDKRLKEAYDYAQERYSHVQKRIFIEGQASYWRILRNPARFIAAARHDAQAKYGAESLRQGTVSDWRGPVIPFFALAVLGVILLSTILSILVVALGSLLFGKLRTETFKAHKRMYILLLGVVIFSIVLMVFNLTAHNSFFKMASGMLAEYAWLLAAIFISMLIRLDSEESRCAFLAYLPTLFLALVVISLRIIFIPNSVINLVFPPLLLLFVIWQVIANIRLSGRIPKADLAYIWISLAVTIGAAVTSWSGYVMLALLILIWWIFQLTVLQTISATADLLSRYHDGHILERKRRYHKKNPGLPLKGKGAFIEVTWFYDLVKMVLVPAALVWSVPVCIFMAGNVFDLSSASLELFTKPLVENERWIVLSLDKLMIILSLWFVFRYLIYAGKATYRILKSRSVMRKLDDGLVFKESDINFNLAENLITLLLWGLYVIIAFVMLKIPTTALTIITTGLATGVGFALKDVLNNFFYGIQLMSGRLRVGDVIECDGVRGTVESMSYQSTQVAASDGSLIVFTNSTLFSKNYKNLTRGRQYEQLSFLVGVKYGTDIEQARRIILEALEPLQAVDKYGRQIVDTKRGVSVRVYAFGDNSVDLQVLQYTTVDEHYTYAAKAKELIYNALNENGIEIPFPQRDLYIKEMPQQKE